jgi:UDP-glucose 4-epimerase
MARELYADVYDGKGLDITGVRYFSVYGPHEKAKGRFANIVSQFLWSMMNDESPKIFGDGEQTRDFTFVKDIARANILAAKKGKSGEYYNIGTGKETTFNTVVSKLNDELGKDIEPEKVENPIKNYVRRTKADISKAKEDLGYEPEYSFEEGLKETVEYYKK